MSLCNRSAQQQQKQQQKHQLNKCKICQNWNLRAEYFCVTINNFRLSLP